MSNVPQIALAEKPKYPHHGLRGKRYRQTYKSLLEKQGGLCAICHRGSREVPRGRFCIDHCHVTGKIRGILCESCNLWLGEIENYGCEEFDNKIPFEVLSIIPLRCVPRRGESFFIERFPDGKDNYDELYASIERWLNKHKEAVLLYLEEVTPHV